ncbi:MAG: hypothetical protein WBH36_07515, partial [Syntrophobacteria bacterium]
CARLAEMKLTDRRKLTGLEPGREDIILAGGLVTLEIMDTFGFSRFTVSDAGLLEGLFLDLCRTLSSSPENGSKSGVDDFFDTGVVEGAFS